VFCGDGALSVETCVSAKNSPLQSRQWDRIKTSSVVEAFKAVKDGRGKVTERGKVIHPRNRVEGTRVVCVVINSVGMNNRFTRSNYDGMCWLKDSL